MTIAQSPIREPKHRRFAAVMAAVLLMSALSGCVVRRSATGVTTTGTTGTTATNDRSIDTPHNILSRPA